MKLFLFERLQFLEATCTKPLPCHGRSCFKCRKCRDWYHNGQQWTRRGGSTCTSGYDHRDNDDSASSDDDYAGAGRRRYLRRRARRDRHMCSCDKKALK
jgi:hypothetical protein